MKPLVLFLLLTAASAQDARELFRNHCAVCHGGDGRGTERGPNLANNRRVRSQTVDHLRAVIPGGGMPAFTFLADTVLEPARR